MTWYWIKSQKGKAAARLVECSNEQSIYEVYDCDNHGLQTTGYFTAILTEKDLVPFIMDEDFIYFI